jgi:hypothetical protein
MECCSPPPLISLTIRMNYFVILHYMNVIICISSKYPQPFLYDCIKNIYEKQIHIHTPENSNYTYAIHVVDSCSDVLDMYEKISQDFPDVVIHMIGNTHYEYGAWKYILEKYESADIYICIQDSTCIHTYIDLTTVDNTTAYTFHHHSGYNSHLSIKELGIENIKNSNLNYAPIIHSNFNLAQHSSFIVTKHVLQDIFRHLTIPPIDKTGSCFCERNFGIYFLVKGIRTIDLYRNMSKEHGNRL